MMSKTWWENKSNHDTDDNEETPEPATGTGLISMPRGQSERMAMCQIGQTGETLFPHKESQKAKEQSEEMWKRRWREGLTLLWVRDTVGRWVGGGSVAVIGVD